jgi:hypothetical protein
LVFFTASNPGIDMGGMFGESKFEVLKKIPGNLIPKTIRVSIPATLPQVLQAIGEEGFQFPVIFKPDLGEKGHMVKKIANEKDIDSYIAKTRIDFLIQELVDLPFEFGVFYRRFPGDARGEVTSVVLKEMLTVTGDGKSSLQQLIFKKERAKLQWERLREKFKDRLNEILAAGDTLELVSIGNHALGTKFLDGSYLINQKLSDVFDEISKQVDGFYYGRFDLRCASVDDLYSGKVKIMELNGCGAEPAHIYEPGYPLTKAIGVTLKHWRNIYEISRMNHNRGVRYVSIPVAFEFYKKFRKALKT